MIAADTDRKATSMKRARASINDIYVTVSEDEAGIPGQAGYARYKNTFLTNAGPDTGRFSTRWEYRIRDVHHDTVLGPCRDTEREFTVYADKRINGNDLPKAGVKITEHKKKPLDITTVEILDDQGRRNGLYQQYSSDRLSREAFYVHGRRLNFFATQVLKLCSSSKVMQQFHEVKSVIQELQNTRVYDENAREKTYRHERPSV